MLLAHWLLRSARCGASIAVVWATAGTWISVDAAQVAAAQAHLQAEYVATISGVPVGRGSWAVDISANEYTAVASGTTAGLLDLLIGAHGTGATHGTVNDGQPVPSTYAATIIDRHHIDEVHMSLRGGNVTNYSVEPPMDDNPDRIPVKDADRRGVIDPMTSALTRVGGTGDPVSPAACERKAPVFDGRVRYDLRSEYKRMEYVRADGYQGPAVVCALYFNPISGYIPGRAAIRYLVQVRDAEVWLAPIAGTRVLVPIRFSMPTPLGTGVLQARQFVTSPQPAHSASKTQ